MNIAVIWTDILALLGRAWWIEIFTAQPNCTYYFGPFANANEATGATCGYVDDLEGESAQGIQVQVKRCKPHRLTIEHE